jgi:hypothetical protein
MPLEYRVLLLEALLDKEKAEKEKEKVEKEKELLKRDLQSTIRDLLWYQGKLNMRGLFGKSWTRLHRCSRHRVDASVPQHIFCYCSLRGVAAVRGPVA